MKIYRRWITRNGSIAVIHEERVNPIDGCVYYIGEIYDQVRREWMVNETWTDRHLGNKPDYDLIKEDK